MTQRLPHVVIVDDDEQILDVCRESLERAAFRVSSFTSAFAAIKAVNHEGADLILTDLGMPEAPGDVLCLLEPELGHPVPVIIMTGDISRVPAWCFEHGRHVQVLPKPFLPSHLVALCQQLHKAHARPA